MEEVTDEEKLKAMENLKVQIFDYVKLLGEQNQKQELIAKEQTRIRMWLTLLFFCVLGAILVCVILILTRPLPSTQTMLKEIVLLRQDASEARQENLQMQKMFLKQDSLRFKSDSIRKTEKDTLYYLP